MDDESCKKKELFKLWQSSRPTFSWLFWERNLVGRLHHSRLSPLSHPVLSDEGSRAGLCLQGGNTSQCSAEGRVL